MMTHLNHSLVPISIPHPTLMLGQLEASSAMEQLKALLGEDALNIVKAIIILFVGWIVALIAKSIIRGLLKKTEIDNKIATWITGSKETSKIPIENWIADGVYWFVILFTIVAVLQTLQLQAVYEPLNELLNEITNFLPRLLAAAIWLGVAWVVATIVKLIVIKGLGTFNLDQRLGQEIVDETAAEPRSAPVGISETIGNALYWFIFFFFLTPILETLGLESTLAPLRGLIDEVLLILPDLFAAVLIGLVGWFIAQVVRRLVTNLLAATGVDQVGENFGLSATAGRQSLSWILGTIAYVLILIPVAISALEVAQIEAISAPAIDMLDQVLTLLPKLLAASIILTLAYVVGEYISEMVTSILTGFGFDNVLNWLGLSSVIGTSSTDVFETPPTDTFETSVDDVFEPFPTDETAEFLPPRSSGKTPSQIVGRIALIAVMLIAALTAVDILQIEALTQVVGVILAIAGQVLVALLVFSLGLYFSNITYNALASSGTRQAKIMAQASRIIILTLVGAMALEQMGIATNIVNLAFGLLVGGIAVAIALAFGLGGKDVAGEQVRNWLDSMKGD